MTSLPIKAMLSLPADRLNDQSLALIRRRLASEELDPESILEVLRWCPKTASDDLGRAALGRFPSLADPGSPDLEIVEICLRNAWTPAASRPEVAQSGGDAVIEAVAERISNSYEAAYYTETRVALLRALTSLLEQVASNDQKAGPGRGDTRATAVEQLDASLRLAISQVVEDSEVAPVLDLIGVADQLELASDAEIAASAVQVFASRPRALVEYPYERGAGVPSVVQPELIRQLVNLVNQLDESAVSALLAIDTPEAIDALARSLETLIGQGSHAFVRTTLEANAALSSLRSRLAEAAFRAERDDVDELLFCISLGDALSDDQTETLLGKIVEHLVYVDDRDDGETLLGALLTSPSLRDSTPEVVCALWDRIKSDPEPPMENLELVVVHSDQLATPQRTALVNRIRDWLGDASLQDSLLPALTKTRLKNPHRDKLVKVLLQRQDEAVAPDNHVGRAAFVSTAKAVGQGAKPAEKLINEALRQMAKSGGEDGRAVVKLVRSGESDELPV